MPRSKPKPRPLSPSPPPPFRKEWIAIAVITLLAAALRLAFPDRMAIEHFDEGVYASNIFFSETEGGQYPYRHLYAPPLLPWLIEWGIIFLGPESIAPFLPALVLGIATVPLMWWVGRSWFGPLAGLAAALLVATSDFHILYSRAALTDVPVMFFIVLAVYFYFESVRRESLKWSMYAGLATGLAWWTKYTGWLPLAISATGSAAWVLGDLRSGWPRMRERGIKVSWCWCVMAITAFVVWAPVLYGLQEHGGYAAVAENHRGYLISEPVEWFRNAYLQGAKLDVLSGTVTGLGLALVAGFIPLMKNRPRWWDWTGAAVLAIGILLATASLGPVVTTGLFAVIGLLLEAFWRLRRPLDDSGEPGQSTLPLWLLTAWLIGMTLTTPLYTPYPRMAFPWLIAAMLLCCRWLASSGATRVPREGWSRLVVLGATLAVLPVIVFIVHRPSLHQLSQISVFDVERAFQFEGKSWKSRIGAKIAAIEILKELQDVDRPVVLFTYGEPALFYYLRANLADDEVAIIPTGAQRVFEHPVPGAGTFVAIRANSWWEMTAPEVRDGEWNIDLSYRVYAPNNGSPLPLTPDDWKWTLPTSAVELYVSSSLLVQLDNNGTSRSLSSLGASWNAAEQLWFVQIGDDPAD